MVVVLEWLKLIFNLSKFIFKYITKGNFNQKVILILWIVVSVNCFLLFFLFKERGEIPSEFDNETSDTEVHQEIKKALRACGDQSFIQWSVLEENATLHGKYLRFKTVDGCDADRTRFRKKEDCVVNIKYNNPMYLKKHFINIKTLNFIENDPILPNGSKFEELTPVWFVLVDKEGKETKEAEFLKENTGEFYRIINKTNLKLSEIGVIKVRSRNKFGKPVLYIISISFLPNAEKSCSHAGDYLVKIAKKTIKNQ